MPCFVLLWWQSLPQKEKTFLKAYPNRNSQGFIISYPALYAKQAHSHGEEIYIGLLLMQLMKLKQLDGMKKSNNLSCLMVMLLVQPS